MKGSALHHFHYDRHHHHDGGHRRKRMFDSGEFRIVLLLLIETKPRHGYELIKDLEERMGGEYSPSPGVVYPTLALLEDMGYIAASEATGVKKVFALTDEGRVFLDENRHTGQEALHRTTSSVPERPRAVERAIENFKAALRLRLSSANLSPKEIKHIADTLDHAAREIESGPAK